MEVIFKNIGGTGSYINDDDDEYTAEVKARIADAVDFERSYLSRAREVNMAYYKGILPALDTPIEELYGDPSVIDDDAPNKSTFVSTDVRDTVLTVLPSLVRIFVADERVANFVPRRADQQDLADVQYDMANHVIFQENEGVLMLYGLFKDALTVKIGVTKWWTDKEYEVTEDQFSGVTEDQIMMLIEEAPDGAELVRADQRQDGTFDVTIRFVKDKPVIRVEAVPPDEFRISRNAKTAKTAPLIGHEYQTTMSELVKKGYDPDELLDYMSAPPVFSEERQMRNPGLTDSGQFDDGINYGEFYIRIDKDGDGVDELRRICTIGDNYQIIEDEVVSRVNMAIWSGDPVSHTAIGDCLADLVIDVQRIKSYMMRGQLDNLAEVINPRMVVNQLTTNLEDALSDDVGTVIRTTGDVNAAVSFSRPPYAGAEVQTTIDYIDQVRASRTGITEASKGLDPKAMQSTTLSGIDAIISGAQERIELIARLLAETGLRPTIIGIVHELINNPNPKREEKLRGKWTQVDPSLFDPTFRLEINPKLGKGSDMIRLQALSTVQETQTMIISKYGIKNPIVSPQNFLNTIEDRLSLVNIKNFDRYFTPLTPEVNQQIMTAPDEPDPAAVLAQAEMEKVKAQVVKAISDRDVKVDQQKLQELQAKMDDDFKRDKLNLDTMVALLDILKTAETAAQEAQVPGGVKSENQPPS